MTDVPPSGSAAAPDAPSDFIRDAVRQDLATGRFTYVRTRWPPEPNGYLHIGHAKAICLDFGIAGDGGWIAGRPSDGHYWTPDRNPGSPGGGS